MKSVTVSAPGKLLLCGDHGVVHGYPCLATAVDQRLFVTLEQSQESDFILHNLESSETYQKKMSELGKGEIPKTAAFVEQTCLSFFKRYSHLSKDSGLKITTQSQFSTLFGFGSSSAVSVACVKALADFFEVELDNHQLFEIAYEAVIAVQGVGSGFDLAAALWGEIIYYVTPAKVVRTVSPNNGASLPIVVGYTGIKADTPTLVRVVAQQLATEPDFVKSSFEVMAGEVARSEQAIQAGDWLTLGKSFSVCQEQLRQLKMSSSELENLIAAAEGAGAYGAKLSGAGGGDCMIAVVSEENRAAVEKAITAAGGQVMNVRLQADGVRRETTERIKE